MTRDEGFLKYSGNPEEKEEESRDFVKFVDNPVDDYSGRYSDGYSGDSEPGDFLEHHGIAGQKWGVRQGPPYPLVARAGRTIHYNVGKMTEKTKAAYQKTKAAAASRKTAKAEAKAAKVQAKVAKKEAKKAKDSNIADVGPKKFAKSKQRISEMSSEELKARIERLKLEEEYRKYLNGGQLQSSKVAGGKAVTNVLLNAYGQSTIKKVADELTLGLVRVGTTYAQESVKSHVSRVNQRRQARDQVIKNAVADKLKKHNEEKALEKKRAEEAYQDAREVRNSAYKAYWQARAGQMGNMDADYERERRKAARNMSRDVWNSTHYRQHYLPGSSTWTGEYSYYT